MPPVFCSAPDLTLEELEAELGLIGSAKRRRREHSDGEEAGQDEEETPLAVPLALRRRLRSSPAVGAEYLASSRE